MGVALAAIADDDDLLFLDQADIGVTIVMRLAWTWFSFVKSAACQPAGDPMNMSGHPIVPLHV